MPAASPRAAILLFTRTAGEEAAHKNFVGHGARGSNTAMAAQLIARTTAVAQQDDIDFQCVDTRQQVGRTFGERLTYALAQGFAQGYDRLIVIGNDCPQLSLTLVRQALRELDQHDAVLGPATDGGVYLLGVRREAFSAAAWAVLPWQTARLGQALAGILQQAGAAIHALPLLADVDTARDLARLLPQLALRTRRRLSRLLAVSRPAAQRLRAVWQVREARPRPLRGPPAG